MNNKKSTKFILFTLCLSMLCGMAYAQNGKPTILKGKFNGYRGEEAIMFFGLEDEQGKDIEVDKEGNFSLTATIDKPYFDAMMNVDQYFMRFYVEPGGTYIFDIDLSDESKYTITGSHERENALWKRYIFDFFMSYNIEDKLLAHAENFNTYKTFIDSLARSLKEEANATQNSVFIPEVEKSVDESRLYYYYYYALLAAQRTGAVTDDTYFNEWLAARQWGAADEQAILQYNVFASAITYSFKDVDKRVALQTLKKIIPEPHALNSVATAVMLDYLSQGGKGEREQVYVCYQTICTDPELLARVEKAYEGSRFLAEGSMAPDFVMQDINGREVAFSDLQGKLLYVDVWATWCGPCKAQIPHFAKLANQFKDDDRIAFISISIDDNLNAWKKMITEDQPEWPQYIVQGDAQADFSQKYQITSIPRFMLFDRKGKIINVNASIPANEDMTAYLEKLLEIED